MADNEFINAGVDERIKHMQIEITELKQQTAKIQSKSDENLNGRLIDKIQMLFDNLQLENQRRDSERLRREEKQDIASDKQTLIITVIGENITRITSKMDTLETKVTTLETKQVELTKRFDDSEDKTKIDTSTLTKTAITVGSSAIFLALVAFVIQYIF